MKKLILLSLFISGLAFADEVKVHANKFSVKDVDPYSSHMWVRIFEWEGWIREPEQEDLGLVSNFVGQAYRRKDKRIELPPLVLEDFESVLSDEYEAEAFHFMYSERNEVEEDEIGRDSGMVIRLQVLTDVAKNLDLADLTVDKVAEVISKADNPHIHKKVSKSFVQQFLDPVHASHKDVKNAKDGELYLSIINMGEDFYNCATLNNTLIQRAEIGGVSVFDENFRLYVINSVREVSQGELAGLQNVVEPGAVRVFEQKVLYSSSVVKSGVNYLAFYKTDVGVKMSFNSVMTVTEQALYAPMVLLNGVSIMRAVTDNTYTDGVTFKHNKAVISQKHLELEPLSGKCSKGLAQGVGRYIYGLAKKIAGE